MHTVPSSSASLDEGFERFWAEFPRRQKKKDARKAWASLRPDAALIEQMLYAIGWQRQQDQWLKDNGQFIPLAGSWLRGERWEDEPLKQTPGDSAARRRAAEGEEWQKTLTFKRLIEGGMSRAAAHRQVYGE